MFSFYNQSILKSGFDYFAVFSFIVCLTFPNIADSGTSLETIQQNWQFDCQREEIAPLHGIDNNILFQDEPTLVLSGGGKVSANGNWYTVMDVEPGKYYLFKTYYLGKLVEEPNRCILARILWRDETGKQIGRAEYPATSRLKSPENWNIIEQTYRVPEKTKRARIDLVYRWDAEGTVHFGGTVFEQTAVPEPRTVRLAAVHFRPRNSPSPKNNLEQFAGFITRAANEKADIVCLPEGITMVGTDLDYVSASEPVPGPTTRFLGEIARKHKLYIVAGITEKQGDIVYNTAVLIDRKGELAGRYRKVSLPREEIDGGVTPGDSLPVFDTDFGRIGIMICWDVFFPEPARGLALQGAEVIFMPIWGGNLTLARARAIENQIYLVSSTYDMKTAVFDREGEIIQEATENNPVIVVEVDLNKQTLWPWLGDFKNRIPREMPSRKARRYNIE
ncbi:carbon-nitrogen hydrolase family protein [candidate division KSB1 bacterium]|nr:carbon-nitrogen hydrolase family protein [candidate division KSB1 bacterium]